MIVTSDGDKKTLVHRKIAFRTLIPQSDNKYCSSSKEYTEFKSILSLSTCYLQKNEKHIH